MGKKIFYIILGVIAILGLTFLMLSFQTKRRNQEVYLEQLIKAKDGDYTNFIKYQTIYHQKIEEEITTDYQIDIFITIVTKDLKEKELVVFVRNLNDVDKAESTKDKDDKTKLTVNANDFSYNSTNKDYYGDFAVSYGLNKYGFYYYIIPFSKADNYEFIIHDYNGFTIYNDTISVPIDSNEEIKNSYIKGFTVEEITEMIKADRSYLTPVYVVFSVGVGAMVLMLVLTSKMVKRKREF